MSIEVFADVMDYLYFICWKI